MAEVREINEAQFEDEVLKSPLPALVDFWAPWCNPCRMLAPVLNELAKDYEGRLNFVKVNVDQNSNLAARFGVMSIPTLILFKDGRPAETMMGAQPKQSLAGAINKHI